MIELLTDRDVARQLKLSPKFGHLTVQRWVREQKLKAYRVGDLYRFEQVFVDDMLEKSLRR